MIPCEFVATDGLYCGKAFDVHCMNFERCIRTDRCEWRKFHGLDQPGYTHLYKPKRAPTK